MNTRETIAADLGRLGVQPGDLIMVHASLKAIGPVHGGAASVVSALCDAAGITGTLMDTPRGTDRPTKKRSMAPGWTRNGDTNGRRSTRPHQGRIAASAS